jgi:hypothetical protein
VVELKAKKLESFPEKSKGLLGFDKPTSIYFKTRWGIHTFFMKFPIDVVVLDRQSRVVVLRKNLKPNRIFMWNPVYEEVLELPVGTILRLKLHKNQQINLT